jgi:hypothetical protein
VAEPRPALSVAAAVTGAAWPLLAAWLALWSAGAATAQPSAPDISGTWVLNLEASDDPDRKIEKAIRSVGGRADSEGRRGRGRYKGGPPEQEIYDHLIYDETLRITQAGAEIHMVYPGGFERRFHTDGRGRTVSASGSGSGDAGDFSFGAWSGATLNVEAKPRDGGWTMESYTVEASGNRLSVKLRLKPLLFPVEVEANLVYDRAPATR